jgi:hypothetical protein
VKRKWGLAAAALTLAGPVLFVGATGPAHACGYPINPGPVGVGGDPCPVGEQMINCSWAQNLSNGLIIAGPACQGGATMDCSQPPILSGVWCIEEQRLAYVGPDGAFFGLVPGQSSMP